MGIDRRRWSVCVALLGAVAIAAGGCGDDDSSSDSAGGGTTTTPTASTTSESSKAAGGVQEPINEFGAGAEVPSDLPPSGLARADEGVARFTKPLSPIPVSQPVGKTIPTGKTIAVMGCGIPYCKSLVTGVRNAGNVLGWKTDEINAGLTPETIQKAWRQVVTEEPDAVIAFGYPKQLFSQQLAQLKAKDIPVVECCISEEPADGILEILNPGPQGAQMAWWLVHDVKGEPTKILWVNNKDYPLIDKTFQPEFKDEIKKTCPECTVDTLQATSTSYGTTLPNQIVSYLRAHKDIEYLALGAGPMAFGLPAALKSAGIDIPIVEDNPDIINNKQIASGQEHAGIGFPGAETMAQLVDILARHFAGAPPSGSRAPNSLIFTKENIGDPSVYPVIYPDFLSQYTKLWGK